GKAAAARFFPGQLFVDQDDAQTGGCQLLGGECPRWTATQNRHTLHCFLGAGGWAAGRSSGDGMLPPLCGLAAGGAAVEPCWPPSPRPTTTHFPSFCSMWYVICIPCAALPPLAITVTAASA